MPMPSLSVTSRGLVALPAAAALFLLAGAAPAVAADGSYTVQLRQELPRTATSTDGAAPQEDQCPGIPAAQDGWHFVLPGKTSDFVKLTVTFKPGGQQVVTDFGPPSDKHAYVASAPGAELVSAVAEVKGGDLELFNLSHTCPAASAGQPEDKPTVKGCGNDASDTPGTSCPKPSKPCQKATSQTPGTPCDKPSKPCEEATSQTPGEPCEKTPATPSDDASDQPAPSASPNGGGDGDLAETGAGPAIGLAGAAALLLAAGGYLVMRRRKAAAQQD